MCTDYLEFLKEELKKFSVEDIDIGKTADFHIQRSGKQILNIKQEILDTGNWENNLLNIADKQEISGEIRYNLYFIYAKRRGQKYVITFRKNKEGKERLRLITTIPLGRKTVQKAVKKLGNKFKKNMPFNLV